MSPIGQILPVSAKSALAFQATAGALVEFLSSGVNLREADLVETLSRGRRHFSPSRGVICQNRSSYSVHYGEPIKRVPYGKSSENLVWTFPGQGMRFDWESIADLNGFKVFQDRFNDILDGLRFRLGDCLFTEKIGAFLGKADYSHLCSNERGTIHDQALVFAVELSLSALWLSFGFQPVALVGHSVGEIAAAVSASVLTLDEALDLIVVRSVEMERVPGKGFMCQVDADAESLQAPLQEFGLEVACKNCPDRAVVGGPDTAYEVLEKYCEENGLRHHRLEVANAFHTEIMAPAARALREYGPTLQPRSPKIPIFSTCPTQQFEPFTLEYWAEQMRSCVDFKSALERVLDRVAEPVFFELGLGQVLSTFARSTAACKCQDELGVISGISRTEHPVAEKIADLFAAGYAIPWNKLNKTGAGSLVPMPTYRFSRHEIASKVFGMQVAGQSGISLPFFGDASISKSTVFEISAQYVDWLKGHQVNGIYVVPTAGVLAMIFDFLPSSDHTTTIRLDNVVFEAPIVLDAAKSTCQIGIQLERGERPQVALYSRSTGRKAAWRRNATAVVGFFADRPDDLKPFAGGGESVSSEALYAHFASQGMEYGPEYKRIETSWRAENALHARLCPLPDATGLTGLITALNAMLQAMTYVQSAQEQATTLLAANIDSIRLLDLGGSAGPGTVSACDDGKSYVVLRDVRERPVCVMKGVKPPSSTTSAPKGTGIPDGRMDRPVLTKVAEVLGVDSKSLDLNGSLTDNGLDSFQLIELRLALQELTNTHIPLSSISEGLSLDEIERRFAAVVSEANSRVVTTDSPAPGTIKQSRPKIFFIEGILGQVGGEVGLRQSVKDYMDVIGLSAPESGNVDDVVAVARQMADAIEHEQTDGPLRLVGHSFGAMLVYSLAVEFGRRGREIERIVAIDGLLAPALSPYHTARLDDNDFDRLVHMSRGTPVPPRSRTSRAHGAVLGKLKRVFDQNCRIADTAQIYAPIYSPVTLVLPTQDNVTGITNDLFLKNLGAIQSAAGVKDMLDVDLLWVNGDHFSMIRRPAIDKLGCEFLSLE
ncbi:acyltransferase domain-containing protein (plasmid) [Sinorhizobium garamanticum]|uniref:Acyltransferase domain-containing protein n=1 Tax=Sinorhizobium garamanticum TaxID=680247 RepID=A0ABY8DL75_9HYPH|nr:acyltransferase domain-containing protein [Sinorhizobium garamanticum]WEX91653.1 acyltransferase domain-containing protein [Sinorhizobium garamanticum]